MVSKAASEAAPPPDNPDETQLLGIEPGEAVVSTEVDQLEATVDGLAVEAGIEATVWDKFRQVVEPLGKHSPAHYAHSLRVAIYAYGLASADETQDDMHLPLFAGLGHDIGKVELDEELLEMRARPNEAQRQEIQIHAEEGFTILSNAGFPFTAAVAGRHHQYQENPYGILLSDSRLPLMDDKDLNYLDAISRLVAEADAFDAMTTRRNDRSAALAGDEAAIRAELLKQFPGTETRADWLFANKLPAEVS